MYDGYLDLAGQEVINTSRAIAYAREAGLNISCDDCPDLYAALGDEPYEGVAQDPAPWYDPNLPESRTFLGVVGMDVVGTSSSTLTRVPVPLVADGSAVGTPRKAHREVAYTVGLVARGECGISYGMEWLASTLQGGVCPGVACGGDEMCMFSCCPSEVAGGITDPCDPLPPPPGPPPPPVNGLGAAQLRHMYDVALLDGPALVQQQYLSGGLIWATVNFTLIVGKPWIYREPLRQLRDWIPLGTQPVTEAIDPDAVYEQCPEFEPCLQDPTCPAPPMPPRPPIPPNPCYEGGPAVFRRVLVELDPLAPPEWSELVPVIEVSTGSAELRRLYVRFWSNLHNQPCSQLDDPCKACFDVAVAYLPQGALLTVDGRVQRARVGCPQGTEGFVYTSPTLFGAGGRVFEWPVFTCPTGLCVEVLSLASATARNARIRVRMVPRGDAA